MTRFAAALEAAALLASLTLAGCGEGSGPAEVKFGRDVCEMCGMIISDPRFVSEIRLADGKPHKFDDVGDAVNFLAKTCVEPTAAKEFWAMDSAGGKAWLDARKAFYVSAETPMNYGYGAVAAAAPGAIDFEAMRVRAVRPENACKGAPKAGGG